MTERKLDWEKIKLAKKYQLEGLSPEESERYLFWKKTDPDFARAVEAMASKRTFAQDVKELGSIDEQAAWERFSCKNNRVEPLRKERSYASWYRIAAVFVGVMVCAAVWWGEFSDQREETPQPIPAGTFANKLGTVSTFLLPDSTRIWLSSGSTLRYAEGFTTNRRVELEGEAFFEVKRNPDFPFVIVTEGLETKVLGTSFNLRAYPGEVIDLSVYSGKVQFGQQAGDHRLFHLSKGQSISWTSLAGFSEVTVFDPNVDADWKSGLFRFDHASLDDIVRSLQHWYPVEFEVGGSSGRCRFSGEFHRSSLEQVLEVLSYTLNLSYQIHENTVEIKSNPC